MRDVVRHGGLSRLSAHGGGEEWITCGLGDSPPLRAKLFIAPFRLPDVSPHLRVHPHSSPFIAGDQTPIRGDPLSRGSCAMFFRRSDHQIRRSPNGHTPPPVGPNLSRPYPNFIPTSSRLGTPIASQPHPIGSSLTLRGTGSHKPSRHSGSNAR
jgi:hypothetical protein